MKTTWNGYAFIYVKHIVSRLQAYMCNIICSKWTMKMENEEIETRIQWAGSDARNNRNEPENLEISFQLKLDWNEREKQLAEKCEPEIGHTPNCLEADQQHSRAEWPESLKLSQSCVAFGKHVYCMEWVKEMQFNGIDGETFHTWCKTISFSHSRGVRETQSSTLTMLLFIRRHILFSLSIQHAVCYLHAQLTSYCVSSIAEFHTSYSLVCSVTVIGQKFDDTLACRSAHYMHSGRLACQHW